MKETEREIIRCDDNCGAYVEPQTLEDYKKTLEHYKYHSVDSGCSHAC